MSTEKLLLIDGLNLFLRNWSAVPMMDANGEACGGFVGTLRSLKSLLREGQYDRTLFCWDGKGGSAKRRGLYSGYKDGRTPRLNRQYDFETIEASQANLRFQYGRVKKYLEMLGITQVEVENCEADDVIALLCRSVFDDTDKVIVSTDRDFFQLIDTKTVVYSPIKKVYYSCDRFREELGVLPENYIFIKAICGDGSDNVKGVGDVAGMKGLGPKTVTKFFPVLNEREVSAEELHQIAQVLVPKGRREKELLKALLDRWDVVIENFRIMQLSSPIISPQSVHSIRHQAEREPPPFNATSTKLALLKDGIQLRDADIFQVFNEYHVRRLAAREGHKNV